MASAPPGMDRELIETVLKKSLLVNKSKDVEILDKKSIKRVSNTVTSLQNAFNKIYASTSNVKNIHQYEERKLQNRKKEITMETKTRTSAIAGGAEFQVGIVPDLIRRLSVSIEELTTNLDKLNLSPSDCACDSYDDYDFDFDDDDDDRRRRRRRTRGRRGPRRTPRTPRRTPNVRRVPRLPRIPRLPPVAGGAAAAAGAAVAVTAAVFYGFNKLITGMHGDVQRETETGLAPYGMTPVFNRQGFTSGWKIKALGDKVVSIDELNRNPEYEYWRNIRDAYGPTRRSVSGDRAREWLSKNRPPTSVNGRAVDRTVINAANRAIAQSARVNAAATRQAQPSFSTRFSNYINQTITNMSSWALGAAGAAGGLLGGLIGGGGSPGTLGPGGYAPIGDLRGATGDWKNDTEFLAAVDRVARNLNVDSRDLLGLMHSESGMRPGIHNRSNPDAVGLIQFTRYARPALGVTREQILAMSRAQQMTLVERHLRNTGLPNGANAGQLYAAVYLPGIARSRNWSGILTRSGEVYYNRNTRLDENGDGVIDIADLAREVSNKRMEIGLGPSPSISGGNMLAGDTVDMQGGGTGRITSRYGVSRRRADGSIYTHAGIDIAAPHGTIVRSAYSGTIRVAGQVSGYGTAVYIDHAQGYRTIYGHLSALGPGIRSGIRVSEGQIIGAVGSTGRSTGDHLHYELHGPGGQIDPTTSYQRRPWIVGGRSAARVAPRALTPMDRSTRRIIERAQAQPDAYPGAPYRVGTTNRDVANMLGGGRGQPAASSWTGAEAFRYLQRR